MAHDKEDESYFCFMQNEKVRVRYAPSPTGPQHLGGIRTALYNFLFAKQQKGTFILRIEDTDQNRFVEGAEEYVLEALNWCGIKYDEGPKIGGEFGPYKQSERKGIYRQYAEQLVENGNAYYAFDKAEELEAVRNKMKEHGAFQYDAKTRLQLKNSLTLPQDIVKQKIDSGEHYVIRFKTPEDEMISFTDLVRGDVEVHSSQIDDKVLFKGDGMPTYHLANIVDDYLMKITHVIRGEEWLPSAPLHVLIYKAFGWNAIRPQFAHVPLILRPDGNGKLSKRDGDRLGFPVFPINWKDPASGEESKGFRERGFLPEPFANMIALLGWHPHGDEEIMSMKEMTEQFSIDRIHKAGAKFDFERAKWFNHEYLKKLDGATLAKYFMPVLKEKNILADEKTVSQICEVLKQRCALINDFWDQSSFFFVEPTEYDESIVQSKWSEISKSRIENLMEMMNRSSDFSGPAIEQLLHTFLAVQEIKAGELLPLLRVMLIGVKNGPSVHDIIAILGKEKSLLRLQAALNVLQPKK